MAEVNEESLWLSSGAYNLVSSCGQGKILVLSSWPRSTNVNSVDGPFQDAEARKLVMCSDAEPESNCYCTMPGNYSATGHYLEALRLDLLRLECSDSVDLMDAMPGSDMDDCQDHNGFLCGPSEAYMRLHCAVLADQLLAFPLDYKCALHVLLMFCSCVVVQVHCRRLDQIVPVFEG
jgi:hypothetical protein